MKKRSLFLFAVLLACGIVVLLVFSRRAKRLSEVGEANRTNISQAKSQQTKALQSSNDSKKLATSGDSQKETLQGFAERYRNSLIRPIEFYGKVIDENNNAISGAVVVFSWTTDNENGVPPRRIESDKDGLFSIDGIRGKALDVRVFKEGYYSVARSNRIAFEYAEEFNPKFHRANPREPVVYHLKRHGTGSPLLTSDKGMQSDFGFAVPNDGTPVRVDLLTRSVSASGQIEVRTQKEPKDIRTGKNNWSLRLIVPNGGLIEHNQEFPFEAPESGYKSEVEWDFAKESTNWVAVFRKEVFIKFGAQPYFGRMRIRTSAFGTAMFFEYAINPTGSRDLEFAQ